MIGVQTPSRVTAGGPSGVSTRKGGGSRRSAGRGGGGYKKSIDYVDEKEASMKHASWVWTSLSHEKCVFHQLYALKNQHEISVKSHGLFFVLHKTASKWRMIAGTKNPTGIGWFDFSRSQMKATIAGWNGGAVKYRNHSGLGTVCGHFLQCFLSVYFRTGCAKTPICAKTPLRVRKSNQIIWFYKLPHTTPIYSILSKAKWRRGVFGTHTPVRRLRYVRF